MVFLQHLLDAGDRMDRCDVRVLYDAGSGLPIMNSQDGGAHPPLEPFPGYAVPGLARGQPPGVLEILGVQLPECPPLFR